MRLLIDDFEDDCYEGTWSDGQFIYPFQDDLDLYKERVATEEARQYNSIMRATRKSDGARNGK